MSYCDQPIKKFRWRAYVNHVALRPTTDDRLIRGIVEDPRTVLASGKTMKRCRARWVSLVDTADGPMVIKMFVERSVRHSMKQSFQRTRALRHVKIANRLMSEGIATPEPVAIFEESIGPINGNSCIMYRFVEGETLNTRPEDLDDYKSPAVINRIRSIVRSRLPELGESLVRSGFVHTDITAENFIKDSDDRLHLIDLDSVRQTRSMAKKQRCVEEFKTLAEEIIVGKR